MGFCMRKSPEMLRMLARGWSDLPKRVTRCQASHASAALRTPLFGAAKREHSNSSEASAAAKQQSLRNPKPFTACEDEHIIRRRKDGAEFKVIAAELGDRKEGIVGNRYRRLVQLHGVDGYVRPGFVRRSASFTPDADARILRRRAEGASFALIADEFGPSMNPGKVAARYSSLIAVIRPGGSDTRQPIKRQQMSDAEYAEILSLKTQGMSFDTIAAHKNISVPFLRSRFYVKYYAIQATSAAESSWSTQDLETLVELKEVHGHSYHQISEALGCTAALVRRKYSEWRKRAGARYERRKAVWTREEDEKLLELRATRGLSWSEIRGQLGNRTREQMSIRYHKYLKYRQGTPATGDGSNAHVNHQELQTMESDTGRPTETGGTGEKPEDE